MHHKVLLLLTDSSHRQTDVWQRDRIRPPASSPVLHQVHESQSRIGEGEATTTTASGRHEVHCSHRQQMHYT